MRARTLTFPAAEILARTLRSKLVKASGVVLSASVLSGVMNVVAIILTIRHLSPEAFGVLTVALTTMQLVGMLSNVGLNETLMTMLSRAGGAQRTNEVVQSLSAILRLRLIVTAVVVIGGFLFTRPIADGVFRQPELAFPLSLGVLGACGVSLYQFGLTTLQAFGAYTRHAAVVLVRFTAILGAVVLVARMGQLDLSAALAINVGAPFLAFAVSLSFASVRVLSGGGNLLELLHRIWDLSKWVVVSNLCSMFFSRLEIYLLTAFASPVELGIYSAAFKLCGGILLLEVAIRTVLFPEVSRRAGSPELASFVRRCLGPLIALSGLVGGLSLLFSLLIPALLGERYAASVPIFLILLVAHTALIPLTPLSLLFFATDRTRAGALCGVVQLAVLVAAGLFLIPSYGASGAAWTQVLVTVTAITYLAVFAWPYLVSSRSPVPVPVANRE